MNNYSFILFNKKNQILKEKLVRKENEIKKLRMEKKHKNTQEKQKKKSITVINFLIENFTYFKYNIINIYLQF